MILCFEISFSWLKQIAPGHKRPSSFGETPPVIMSPTSPLARVAKYSAMASNPFGSSSNPVCIDPMMNLFFISFFPMESGRIAALIIATNVNEIFALHLKVYLAHEVS